MCPCSTGGVVVDGVIVQIDEYLIAEQPLNVFKGVLGEGPQLRMAQSVAGEVVFGDLPDGSDAIVAGILDVVEASSSSRRRDCSALLAGVWRRSWRFSNPTARKQKSYHQTLPRLNSDIGPSVLESP